MPDKAPPSGAGLDHSALLKVIEQASAHEI